MRRRKPHNSNSGNGGKDGKSHNRGGGREGGINVERLNELRTLICVAEDFADVWDFFFDHFGMDDKFIGLGETSHDEELAHIVSTVSESVIGSKVSKREVSLRYIEEHKLAHGAFMTSGGMIAVFYFRDLDKGMVCAVTSLSGGANRLARFSTKVQPPDETWKPDHN